MKKNKCIIPYLLLVALPLLLMGVKTKAQIVIPNNNIISNGDFMSRDPQQRPLRWISGMGLQTATLSGQERHGRNKDDQSLKVADTSTISSVLIRSEKKIADPGSLYTAIAWVPIGQDNLYSSRF